MSCRNRLTPIAIYDNIGYITGHKETPMNTDLMNCKSSELAQLYILAMRFPWLINITPAEIQEALEILVGSRDTIEAIKQARQFHL